MDFIKYKGNLFIVEISNAKELLRNPTPLPVI